MKQSLLIPSIVVMAAISSATAQTSIDNLDAQRSNVVMIRSSVDNGTFETAAGLFVGRDQQSAYFVTACHPLMKPDGSGDPVGEVELQFLTGANVFNAKTLNRYNLNEDLAVVMLPITNLPGTTQVMQQKDPTAELPIHIISHPPSGSWSSWTGLVEDELEVGGDSAFFSTGTNQSLTRGFSGGPVFDSHGNYIGMHLSSSSSFAKNLKSSIILDSLRAWHIPLTNFVSATPVEIVKLVSEFDNRLSEVEGYQKHVADPKSTAADRRTLGILIWRVWYGDHEYHAVDPEFAGVRWVGIVTKLKLAGITTDAAKAERAIHDIEQSEADDPQYANLLAERVKILQDYSHDVLHVAVGDDSYPKKHAP